MNESRTTPSYNVTEAAWRETDDALPGPLQARENELPQESYWAWNGHSIHLDRIDVRDADYHFIIAHGAGGNGRLMLPFTQTVAEAGFSVVAPDLPPFGLSRVAPGHVLAYMDWVILLVDLIRAEAEAVGKPIILFGVSVGGLLAYNAAAMAGGSVAGLVVTTLADPRDPAVRRQFARHPLMLRGLPVLDKLAPLFDRLKLPVSYLSRMQLISNDAFLAQTIMNDRLAAGAWVPLGLLRTMIEARPTVEPEDFVACPVLLVHPEKDRMTPLALSQPFFKRIAAPKTLVVLKNAGHFPIEEPGRSQMREALLDFVRQLDALP